MSEETPPRLDPDERTAMHRLEQVEGLSPEEADALPYGVIRVDRDGAVLAYNAAEAKPADRAPNEVIGKNFFTEVAPCTNVREFAGRFRNGITRGRVHDTFPSRFAFEKGTVHVMVTLHYQEPDEHAWIFVDAFGSG